MGGGSSLLNLPLKGSGLFELFPLSNIPEDGPLIMYLTKKHLRGSRSADPLSRLTQQQNDGDLGLIQGTEQENIFKTMWQL